MQDAGAFGIRVDMPTNGQPATVLFFREEAIEPEIAAKMDATRSLLGLAKGNSQFRLVQSPLRGGPGELGIETRSLIQVLGSLARGIEIPPKHLERKLTPPWKEVPLPEAELLLRVHSGPDRPADSFVAVPYEEEWFWIANDDWKSKRAFSSILFLFTLTDTAGSQQLPTITIPAQ